MNDTQRPRGEPHREIPVWISQPGSPRGPGQRGVLTDEEFEQQKRRILGP
ncbi:SHOCT domain-containing protein [Mycobacterium sp. Z3061]